MHQPPAPSATQKAQQADEAAQKSANPEKSSDHHKLAVQQISDGTGVDEARAESILTILHKVSIRDHDFDSVHRYENGKHDIDNEKVFVIETIPAKTFLYLDNNDQVLEVHKNGKALLLYDNSF